MKIEKTTTGNIVIKNDNKEGVKHRIGGFHQDKFEIISQRKGKSSWNPKKTTC